MTDPASDSVMAMTGLLMSLALRRQVIQWQKQSSEEPDP